MIVENRVCKKHGDCSFILRNDGGFRCRKCATESVLRRVKKKKVELVRMFGGKCSRCGYSKSNAALQFHHTEPKNKSFSIGSKQQSYSLERLIEEAKKCILLCANCHAEVEYAILF